jgi:hypothetical protein
MNKKKLEDVSSDKQFISGIYNYCDRWCERCPQTSRCFNHAIIEEEFAAPESRDIHNESFWKRLSGIMEDTLELIKEKAAAEGIDLDSIELDESESGDRINEIVDDHEIAREAKAYGHLTEDWFNEAEAFFVNTEEVGIETVSSGHKNFPETDEQGDALEIVRWYQYQIYTKLIRAISGREEEASMASDERDGYASDSDGSAKVALIGIDRSIAAWGILHNCFPSFKHHSIRNIINHLDLLRRRAEEHFPEARAFIRPGFDRIDLNG